MKVLIKDGQKVAEVGEVIKQSPAFQAIKADTERYSITPTTFATREYEINLNSWFFTEEYRCETSQARRFGLNFQCEDFMEQVISSPGQKCFDVHGKPPSTTKTAQYSPIHAQSIKLCSLEQRLINMAVEHLIKSGEKAVVVDILARMNGGTDNGCVKVEQGIPEVHSVVLYMNPHVATSSSSGTGATISAVISVIDPSNFLFSSHLSNHKTSVGSVNCVINTLHSGVQIYKPKVIPTGPDKGQYRDCIDTAVKLSFGFNASAVHQDLSNLKDSIPTCEVIKNISNILKIDLSILSEDLPVRVKQTSEPTLVASFNKLQRVVKKNKDLASRVAGSDPYSLYQKQVQYVNSN